MSPHSSQGLNPSSPPTFYSLISIQKLNQTPKLSSQPHKPISNSPPSSFPSFPDFVHPDSPSSYSHSSTPSFRRLFTVVGESIILSSYLLSQFSAPLSHLLLICGNPCENPLPILPRISCAPSTLSIQSTIKLWSSSTVECNMFAIKYPWRRVIENLLMIMIRICLLIKIYLYAHLYIHTDQTKNLIFFSMALQRPPLTATTSFALFKGKHMNQWDMNTYWVVSLFVCRRTSGVGELIATKKLTHVCMYYVWLNEQVLFD